MKQILGTTALQGLSVVISECSSVPFEFDNMLFIESLSYGHDKYNKYNNEMYHRLCFLCYNRTLLFCGLNDAPELSRNFVNTELILMLSRLLPC